MVSLKLFKKLGLWIKPIDITEVKMSSPHPVVLRIGNNKDAV